MALIFCFYHNRSTFSPNSGCRAVVSFNTCEEHAKIQVHLSILGGFAICLVSINFTRCTESSSSARIQVDVIMTTPPAHTQTHTHTLAPFPSNTHTHTHTHTHAFTHRHTHTHTHTHTDTHTEYTNRVHGQTPVLEHIHTEADISLTFDVVRGKNRSTTGEIQTILIQTHPGKDTFHNIKLLRGEIPSREDDEK